MVAGPATLVIDARPIGVRGLLAREILLGRPMLAHLVELARDLGRESVVVVAPEGHGPELREMVELDPEVRLEITGDPPEGPTITLRSDRLYDPRRLRAAIRRGGDPEAAAIWRLDEPNRLAAAGEEWLRRRTYQPLGQFWALSPARRLARALCDTPVRPNVLTILGATTMLAAAGLIAFGPGDVLGVRLGIAALLGVALVLDIADGHLARLQGTASAFGRWLDGFLDECADMVLHAAIAWGHYAATTEPAWLVAGMLYGMGKFGFAYGNLTWAPGSGAVEPSESFSIHPSAKPSGIRRIAIAAGHADVRWHLWILLAALGWLHIELAVFAAYYPARALGGAFRKRRVAAHG